MIVFSSDRIDFTVEHLRDGLGETIFHLYCDEKSAPRNSRLITEISLAPGCSIGKHYHEKEAELYYVVRGEGKLNDNGTEYVVHPGDFQYCNGGRYHAIENIGNGELLLFAVVITE